MSCKNRLKEMREKRNLTLMDVAIFTNISESYLSRLENEPELIPSINILAKLMAFYINFDINNPGKNPDFLLKRYRKLAEKNKKLNRQVFENIVDEFILNE